MRDAAEDSDRIEIALEKAFRLRPVNTQISYSQFRCGIGGTESSLSAVGGDSMFQKQKKQNGE